jgi:hypothetical protein
VCVCVCVRERERERERKCVCARARARVRACVGESVKQKSTGSFVKTKKTKKHGFKTEESRGLDVSEILRYDWMVMSHLQTKKEGAPVRDRGVTGLGFVSNLEI